ncbi:MAG: tRNA pseudouridine(55) synthase TruB [Kofleriaceae bacterium]
MDRSALTHGILIIDKPANRSSASTVDYVKRVLNAERVGHGGTLDPLATGVLLICVNAATKLAGYLLAEDKAYEADAILGVETDTLDRTGRVLATHPVAVTEQALREALGRRCGEQDQIPPMFSAIKQGGVRLYERARAGEDVERAARKIRIDRLELLAFEPPRFRVAITCSKGTYVRSILADLGTELGCGAHLAELRRTRSGRFGIEQAITLEQLDPAELAAHLIPLGRATDLPVIITPDEYLSSIRSGVQLETQAFPGELPAQFQLVDADHRLVAIAHPDRGRLVYDRVFPADATS